MRASFVERDPATATAARGRYAVLQRSLRKLNAAGARIILGSDTGLQDHFFGYAGQRELEAMVGAGMTPAQVMRAAVVRRAVGARPRVPRTRDTAKSRPAHRNCEA